MADLLLPDVGEGLHEAELLEWTVAVGDVVKEGDVVAVVNTEKVTVDLPSPVDGVVVELPWEVGDVVQVGQVLMRFDAAEAPTEQSPTEAPHIVPAAEPPSANGKSDSPARPEAPVVGSVSPDLGAVVAAPSTRRLAAEHAVDLRLVDGSGPGGRILRGDVMAAAERTEVARPRAEGAEAKPTRTLSGLRALSARNLKRSREVAVTCTTTFEVHADGLVEALDRLRDSEPKVTLPALVAVCGAAALRKHPDLNGYLVGDGDSLLVKESIDVAVAVATDAGLTVPVIRDVGNRRLRDVARDLNDAASRARLNQLRPDELRDGTFTVSSTGSMERDGVLATTPVINHPQITTLWVGRIQQAPRVSRGGELEAGPVLRASLSFDHRFVDGAEATTFIADLSAALERPLEAIA